MWAQILRAWIVTGTKQIIQKWLPSENALIYNPKGKEDNREPREYSFEVYVMYKI